MSNKKNKTVDDVINALNAFSQETLSVTHELKQFEKYNHHLKIVGELFNDGLVVLNSRGHIEYINNSALEMFDFKLDEIKNENISILKLIDSNENSITLNDLLSITHENKKGIFYNATGKRKNGENIHIEYSFNSFNRDSSYGFILLIRDCSEKIEKIKKNEKHKYELQKRSNILTITSTLSQMFLDPYKDIEIKINTAIESLGKILNADRVALYLNDNEENIQLTRCAYEWIKTESNIKAQIHKFSSAIDWAITLPNYYKKLTNKEYIHIFSKDLEKPESDLTIEYVNTIIMFPLFKGQLWAGCIVFNYEDEYVFSLEEIEACKISTSVLSSALENNRLTNKIYLSREEIKYRKERNDAISDYIKDCILILNSTQNGLIVYANKSASEFLNYHINELVGRSWPELLEFNEQVRVQKIWLQRFERSDISFDGELKVVTKDNIIKRTHVKTSENIKRPDNTFDVVVSFHEIEDRNPNDRIEWAYDVFNLNKSPQLITDNKLNIIIANDKFLKEFYYNEDILYQMKLNNLFQVKLWNEYYSNYIKKNNKNDFNIEILNSSGNKQKCLISFEPLFKINSNNLKSLLFTFKKN